MTDPQIISIVLSKLEQDDCADFTLPQLANFLAVDKKNLSYQAANNRVHGQYKVGNRYRFRRAEILFRRATGQNIYRK